jgi:hypothetical protein
MNNGILAFSDQNDFANYLVQINQMSKQELIDFQENNDYLSFGLKCDESYFELAQDSLNPDDVMANISNYSDYLELVTDIEGDEDLTLKAKFESSPLYYIMNLEHMYIVGDMAYKVFEEGIIETDISYIDELENISSFDMIDFDGDKINFTPIPLGWSATGNLTSPHDAGTPRIERETNGNNRTKSYIKITQMTSGPAPQFSSMNYVRPYKRTWGIWYWCKRTITYDFETAIDIHRTNGTYKRKQYSHQNTEYKSVIKKLDVFFTPDLNDIESLHYAGYDCSGDTPSTDPVLYSKYTYNL